MSLDIKIGDVLNTRGAVNPWNVYDVTENSDGEARYCCDQGANSYHAVITPGQITHVNGKAVEEDSTTWEGELPPSGTVCEVRENAKGKWVMARVVAHHIDPGWAIYTETMTGGGLLYYGEAGDFRPIPTPEQIEAEKRQQAIDEMWSVYWQPEMKTAKEALGLLYDAGYRKQP